MHFIQFFLCVCGKNRNLGTFKEYDGLLKNQNAFVVDVKKKSDEKLKLM